MHDLKRIRRDLQEGLSLDKHPVAVLVGAGCPSAIRVPAGNGTSEGLIPDVRGLTARVKAVLNADASFVAICEQFAEDGMADPTIEDMLSRVRLLARVVGAGEFRKMKQTDLAALEKALCAEISAVVRAELPGEDTPYHWLVDWVSAISRKTPLQIFTTNYDLLLEQALEERKVAFFDGFIGARNPFFDLRAIEEEQAPARWVRLWKLHGSINWRHEESGAVTRCFPVPDKADGVLIHPSELKYDQSRRMPYLAMLDRLRAFLKQPSALLVTTGYSFADEHLNEVIIQGMRGNPTAAAYALLFNSLDGEPGAARISKSVPTNITFVARDAGVVRGVRGAWLTDPDAESTATTVCELGDFGAFASFLRSLGPVRGV